MAGVRREREERRGGDGTGGEAKERKNRERKRTHMYYQELRTVLGTEDY